MGTKRQTYELKNKDIIDVHEYHDGNYGAKGETRQKKRKPTREEVEKINQLNKARRCRLKLLTYFNPGDVFATWTYDLRKRPSNMKTALKHFQKAMRYVRKEYKKRERELYWIRNIERGTKGAWHIHLIVIEIGDTASILEKAWEHGGTWHTQIKKDGKLFDEDFTKLANYITKNEKTVDVKSDGQLGKSRLKEANYNTSRNMPLPEPKKKTLKRWKREVRPKKGYYIVRIHEGADPIGFSYRRYTMIRIGSRTDKEFKEAAKLWNDITSIST